MCQRKDLASQRPSAIGARVTSRVPGRRASSTAIAGGIPRTSKAGPPPAGPPFWGGWGGGGGGGVVGEGGERRDGGEDEEQAAGAERDDAPGFRPRPARPQGVDQDDRGDAERRLGVRRPGVGIRAGDRATLVPPRGLGEAV